MKNFILSVGDASTSVCAFLTIVFIVLFGLSMFVADKGVLGIIILIMGPGVIVEIFYLAYCIIDIRESLKKIAENTNNQKVQM